MWPVLLTTTRPPLLQEGLDRFREDLACLQSPDAPCTSCGLVVVKNACALGTEQPVGLSDMAMGLCS